MASEDPVIRHMQGLRQQWETAGDAKAVFLGCYQLMTNNTLAAIRRGAFQDQAWVDHLLHRFADYYFGALDTYEREPAAAPLVWQHTFAAAADARVRPIQHLLLGVNAHINYDLVLTLAEVLRPEWNGLPPEQRAARYADHCQVNTVIAQTIDVVQDQVLGPAMPGLRLADALLGRLDERLAAGLIRRWRESVWNNAVHLLAARDDAQTASLLRGVEAETLRLGELIGAHGRLSRAALPGGPAARGVKVLRLPRKRQ